ncbi:hypothetical protein [Bifidobacterium leontopitheci]|uniref:Uncharacterized protein n=1 Tax=Bifidobacterium leontopitheci TaxID=2650774 RepID=A0A6I1GI21_9BIFI|nr:hypothetical protein [Bifidobacterium leontopitheci]KAB7791303.1 hypothetical protein F7D09_0256 [Bifidobacterium leontopitheci]
MTDGKDTRMENVQNEYEEQRRHVLGVALEGAAAETVQRFGAAAKEHLVSYSGVDNETGEQLARSLKTVAGQQVHPDFVKQNIKQQAGFSAEIESVARKNAKNIIDGKGERFKRFDVANDQLVDVVSFDEFGDMISGSQAQMKFVGDSAKELLTALKSDTYKKYRDGNVRMDIPDDYYDVLMGDGPDSIDAQINKLQHKLDEGLLADGSSDKVRQEIDTLRSIKKSLRKSGLTKDEAIEARLHPKLMVAKDVAKLAHKAGVQQAKTGALIGGGTSLVRNLVGCIKGTIKPAEAAKNVGKDAAMAAAFSYATAFSGTAIKGAMQNASSGYMRSLSKTNVASTLVSTTMDVSKAITRYCRGEITGAQCVEQMGQQGLGQLGALMGTAVAMSAISAVGATGLVAVAAGMVGSTIGYTAAVSVYEELSTALNEYEMAKEERIRVERECAEAVELIRQYRIEMNKTVDAYLADKAEAFNAGFETMDQAIVANDVNGYLAGNALIQETMGYRPQFRTQQEFDDLMDSDDAFIL